MIKVLSTNITSPLGFTTGQNYLAVKSGRSALSSYTGWKGIPASFTASLFTDEQTQRLHTDGFTRFESAIIHSVREALEHTAIDITSSRALLIISTTKANVEELSAHEEDDGDYLSPGASARKIARHIGFTTEPITVCNACISGVNAQILAQRLIDSGAYDYAVVCGADCQSPFAVAGFMSFKSLSPSGCRPFDIERTGLNLGEAAATIVFGKCDGTDSGSWKIMAGHLDNDAYHVSAPSPAGDGTYRAAMEVLDGYDRSSLATVSVHGTATMFNDQMESKAIERASLSEIPVSALKGYYGHTLGAAGVLETIITMSAIDDGQILPVRGFSEIGVSGKMDICGYARHTDRKSFVKLISGFGGCNGAILYSRNAEESTQHPVHKELKTKHRIRITPSCLVIDGESIATGSSGKEMLSEIYRTHIGDYPKFHKMDIFSRLAFLASELLIQRDGDTYGDTETAVILFNGSSSVVADRKHIATYSSAEGFFPSPSTFLYTLPNIVTGEIAIRHGFKGETSLYILDGNNGELVEQITGSTFSHSGIRRMITGWVDCSSEDTFEADIKIITT